MKKAESTKKQNFGGTPTATLGALLFTTPMYSATDADTQLATKANASDLTTLQTSVAAINPANFATAAQGALAASALQSVPTATTSMTGAVKKAAALTAPSPTLAVPTLLNGTVSLATVQLLQNRLEQLISNLQAANVLS